MFGPSPVSEWLADRVGPSAVATIGFGLLGGSGSSAASSTRAASLGMAAVLVLLGAGWNRGTVGGSALLVPSVPEAVRSEMEGIGDGAMSLAAAVSAPGRGLIAGISDYRTLSFVARRALAGPTRPSGTRPHGGVTHDHTSAPFRGPTVRERVLHRSL
jgi:hypothetical protein